MSSKFNRELKELVRNQVVSTDIADKISQYYDAKNDSKSNRLFTVFGVLGALLVGSGIILMLAHNWDDFSKMTKTVLAFVPLLIGQCLAGFSILKNKSKTWKESSGTFLFFAVGVSISLISQIYNISGDLGPFLQIWIALCIPLIYVLRSHAVMVLVVLFSTYYALEVGLWEYRDNTTPWMYLVFMLTIIPHYWLQLKKYISSNTTSIFNWILPISIALSLATFINKNEELGFVMYLSLFGLFYTIGRLAIFKGVWVLRNGYLIIGSLGTIILLMIFTFRWPWKEFFNTWSYNSQEFYITIALGVIAIMILGYTIVKKGIKTTDLFQYAFLIFWGLFFGVSGETMLPMVLTNLLVFVLGIITIRKGANTFNFGILNYGLLIISILIICRFFDTNMSFEVKGVLFVAVGTGFFLTNYRMLKKQQKKELNKQKTIS
ncbi:hypothetical protein AB832_05480 [Flavobacteriaceae bacterium (ex Bugula neritina AB1)]|nr:hypothetical protein AB832_05480 [Flavobacteriaceae bacterium (ex Bugula neritina AB1)]